MRSTSFLRVAVDPPVRSPVRTRRPLAATALAAWAVLAGVGFAQDALPPDVDALAAAADPGPYAVGTWGARYVDAARGGRVVRFRVFFPTTGEAVAGTPPAPDPSGAPYPVVVGDGHIAGLYGIHLASHGFVFVAALGQDPWTRHPDPAMVDQPLDLVLGLDLLARGELGVPAGAVDTGRSGVVGYSFGSWNALMVAGARVDPEHFRRTCAERPEGWSDHWWAYVCGAPDGWTAFEARARELGLVPQSGLWAPFGDARVLAAMAMGPEGFDLIGPAGLARVDVPVLLVGAEEDTLNDYAPATTELFAHLPDATLITFGGADHFMMFVPDVQTHFRRFALAFFDARLRGGTAWAEILTEAFVEEVASTLGGHQGFEGLAWSEAGSEPRPR